MKRAKEGSLQATPLECCKKSEASWEGWARIDRKENFSKKKNKKSQGNTAEDSEAAVNAVLCTLAGLNSFSDAINDLHCTRLLFFQKGKQSYLHHSLHLLCPIIT
jgi:hypothetical protein